MSSSKNLLDAALRAYYARLAEQASRPPSVKSVRSVSEEAADSLFDGVSPATVTPPSSHDLAYDEERVLVNGNGKRSRQSPAGPSPAPTCFDLEPAGDEQSVLKKPKREPESPGPATAPLPEVKLEVPAPGDEDSDDDGDFEEVA